MGRPRDRQQAQARRAREDLDKGLKRRDAGLAVESWLKLPPEERGPLQGRVGGLLREEVERLGRDRDRDRDRGGQQARLLALVAHAAAEPALLDGRKDLCWMLLAAALRARDLGRARRLYAPIEAEIAARAPGMHTWLAAFFAGGGQIAPDAVAGLPALPGPGPLPGPDARLGYDAPRPRVKLPAPRSAEEVERSVLLLFALEARPAALRETLLGWIQEAPALAPALARAAGPLAAREALRRAGAGHGPGLMLVLLGELVRWARDELAADVFLGFRMASAALHRHAADPEALRAFASLAAAVATYPEHRAAVVAQAAELPVPETWDAGLKVLLDLYGALLALPGQPDVRLWVRALCLYDRSKEMEQDAIREPPAFLAATLSRLLDEQDGAPIWAWLDQDVDPKERAQVLSVIGDDLPMELGERALEKGFAYQGEGRVAQAMTRLLVLLVNRRDNLPLSGKEVLSVKGATWGDMLRLVEMMEDAGYPVPDDLYDTAEDMDPRERLPREVQVFYLMLQNSFRRGGAPMLERQRALLRRFQDQAVPYSYEVFTMACEEPSSDQEVLRLAERHLSGTPAIEARIHVLQVLFELDCNQAFKQVKDRMLAEYAADAPALARALNMVLMSDGPMALRRELAGALLIADQAHKGERDELHQQMVRMATLYAPRARAKTPAKKPKTAKAKAPAKTPKAKTPKVAAEAKAPAKTPKAKAPKAKAPAKAPKAKAPKPEAAPEQMDLPEVRK